MCKFFCTWKKPQIGVPMMHQIAATVSCNLSALIAGSGFSWLAPIVLWLTSEESEINMTLTQFSWLTSCPQIGFLLSVVPSGMLADRYGRKTVLISAAPLSLLAWILVATTRDITVLFIVRLIQGITIAIAFTVAPVYVAEVSSPKVRGLLGGQFSLMLQVGTVVSYVAGLYLSYQTYIYVQMILSLMFLATFSFMPESPYYYFMVKRKEQAYSSYYWLSGKQATEELLKIEENVQEDMKNKTGWVDLIARKCDRRALWLVQLVSFMRAATGMPSYAAYGTQIFAASSKNIFPTDVLALIMVIVLLICTFLAALFSDTAGRRFLLILSSVGTIISNLAVGVYFYLELETSVNLTIWILYLAVLGFCMSANTGTGNLQTVVQAEFFPSHTRGKGGAITGITSALSTFLVLKLYQPLIDSVGIYMNFFFYAVSIAVSLFLIHIYLPESAGKTLAEVNSLVKVEKSSGVAESEQIEEKIELVV
ncbi:facilitated trehalose transporter Tret1-like [Rhodnius prolixus]